MFRFAVCDDDAIALSAIAGAIESVFEKNDAEVAVQTFLPSSDLFEKLCAEYFHAVFLDINMPRCDGIALGKRLKAQRATLDIIYVSSAEERVFESLSVHPYGFVRKSSFLKDIAGIAKMYIAEHAEHERAILELKVHGSILNLDVGDILYIESIRDYQFFYLLGQKEPEKVRLTMELIEEQLASCGFIRVHKGYLVNFHYIQRIDAADIVLSSGIRVPVSKRKLQRVREKYMELNRRQGVFRLR